MYTHTQQEKHCHFSNLHNMPSEWSEGDGGEIPRYKISDLGCERVPCQSYMQHIWITASLGVCVWNMCFLFALIYRAAYRQSVYRRSSLVMVQDAVLPSLNPSTRVLWEGWAGLQHASITLANKHLHHDHHQHHSTLTFVQYFFY